MDPLIYDDYYGDDALPRGALRKPGPLRRVPARRKALGLLWRALNPMLIHGGGMALASAVLLPLVAAFLAFSGLVPGKAAAYDALYEHQVAFSGLCEIFTFFPLLAFFLSDERRRLAREPELALRKRRNGFFDWWLVAAFAVCSLIMANFIVSFMDLGSEPFQEEMEEVYRATSMPVQLLVVCAIAPVCEELAFRGLIFRRLRDEMSPLLAAVLSGLMFGIYHGNLEQGVFATLMGFIFAMLYEHYGTLKVPIFCHVVNNVYATLSNAWLNGEGGLPEAASIGLLAGSAVGAVALAVFIFKDDERVNAY